MCPGSAHCRCEWCEHTFEMVQDLSHFSASSCCTLLGMQCLCRTLRSPLVRMLSAHFATCLRSDQECMHYLAHPPSHGLRLLTVRGWDSVLANAIIVTSSASLTRVVCAIPPTPGLISVPACYLINVFCLDLGLLCTYTLGLSAVAIYRAVTAANDAIKVQRTIRSSWILIPSGYV